MDDLLYLPENYKKFLQEEIKSITKIYIEKLFPAFANIDKEAEEYSQELFDDICQSVGGENDDPSDVAEFAEEKGIEYYQSLSLAQYGFTAFSISLLYHFWEQQIKKYTTSKILKISF